MSKTVDLAEKQVGKGGKKFLEYCGIHQMTDWCGAFVYWCIKKSDEYKYIKLKNNPLWVPNILKWGRKKKLLIEPEKMRPGDVVLFDFNGNGTPDHVGICRKIPKAGTLYTIEGNTGQWPGVVTKKKRSFHDVLVVLRLKKK